MAIWLLKTEPSVYSYEDLERDGETMWDGVNQPHALQNLRKMEKGDMSLEESLAAYESGVGLYRRCQAALEQAELRVRLLTDPEDPGSAQPFPAQGASDA